MTTRATRKRSSSDTESASSRADKLGELLRAVGIGTGRRVGLFLDDNRDILVARLAVANVGAELLRLPDRASAQSLSAELDAIVTTRANSAQLPPPSSSNVHVYVDACEWPGRR